MQRPSTGLCSKHSYKCPYTNSTHSNSTNGKIMNCCHITVLTELLCINRDYRLDTASYHMCLLWLGNQCWKLKVSNPSWKNEIFYSPLHETVVFVRQLMTTPSSVNCVNFKSNFAKLTGIFCISEIASVTLPKSPFFKECSRTPCLMLTSVISPLGKDSGHQTGFSCSDRNYFLLEISKTYQSCTSVT